MGWNAGIAPDGLVGVSCFGASVKGPTAGGLALEVVCPSTLCIAPIDQHFRVQKGLACLPLTNPPSLSRPPSLSLSPQHCR